MTRLDNSYCAPRTEDEWAAIDALNPRTELRMKGRFVYTLKEHGKRRLWVCHREKGNAKEIPVSRFLDLLHDRIVPWRLEEVGFMPSASPDLLMLSTGHGILCASEDGVWFNHMRVAYNITTFTDLLQQIRFLTPPSNG